MSYLEDCFITPLPAVACVPGSSLHGCTEPASVREPRCICSRRLALAPFRAAQRHPRSHVLDTKRPFPARRRGDRQLVRFGGRTVKSPILRVAPFSESARAVNRRIKRFRARDFRPCSKWNSRSKTDLRPLAWRGKPPRKRGVPSAMSKTSDQRSEEFLRLSGQFQLGMLTTESSHPVTANLSETARGDAGAGRGRRVGIGRHIESRR